jgi:hypothetical protein
MKENQLLREVTVVVQVYYEELNNSIYLQIKKKKNYLQITSIEQFLASYICVMLGIDNIA